MVRLVQAAAERGASDIHLSAALPPAVRVDGELQLLNEPPLQPAETQALAEALLSPAQAERLSRDGEVDLAWHVPGVSRLRVSVYRERGHVALALRLIPLRPPSAREIGLPDAVVRMAERPRGLVLVTGPTGSGKTTTLAALVSHLCETRPLHIVTLEDPIEYVHESRQAVIHQREVGEDTLSFASGLRAALRQDPDVILVGEMRDLETMAIALTAAETGHLVLATLHTQDAAGAVERVIDVFPPSQQGQVRAQLAQTLEGVVAQRLLPRRGGGRVLALEVLVGTTAVRNLIREGKTHQLLSAMQTGQKAGMVTMEAFVNDLVNRGVVAREAAALALAGTP